MIKSYNDLLNLDKKDYKNIYGLILEKDKLTNISIIQSK